MNNKMITIPYADAIEYGENTSALFKALWELTDLIRLESDLKKHHRAYLHVREDIDEKVKEARQIMTKVSVDMIGFYFKVDVPESSNSDENTPFADAADDEAVSIPKDKYELMIDDLLTMSEIIQCVADMRTQDVKAISASSASSSPPSLPLRRTACASIVRRRKKPRTSSTVGRTRLTISTRTSRKMRITSRTSITPTNAH